MQDVCKNIEEYNLGKKHIVLMVADIVTNNKLNPIVTKLFIIFSWQHKN